MSFDVRRKFDVTLFDVDAADLHTELDGPTVFDLRRGTKRPFFASTLLHGNETSGWNSIRRFLADSKEASLVVLVGNIEAAAQNQRHLPHETDFNRVWRQDPWRTNLQELLHEVDPWCGIDIHNNSGPNPHYSVVTNFDSSTLALASMFSDKLIYTEHTKDILGYALSQYCPALTIETGTVDDAESEARAYELLRILSRMDQVPSKPCRELQTFSTRGIVKVEHASESKENFPHFDRKLDNKSFQTLTAGTEFVNCIPAGWHVNVMDPADDVDVTDEFIDFRGDRAYLKRDVVLSMFTRNPVLAVQDCVCYFLNRTSLVYSVT